MGARIHVTTNSHEDWTLPLAGDGEIQTLWRPIVKEENLPLFDMCFTAGILVEDDSYSDILNEASVLLRCIESKVDYVDDSANVVFRCRRLVDILQKYPPNAGNRIYLG